MNLLKQNIVFQEWLYITYNSLKPLLQKFKIYDVD